jgi:hypothetical protein
MSQSESLGVSKIDDSQVVTSAHWTAGHGAGGETATDPRIPNSAARVTPLAGFASVELNTWKRDREGCPSTGYERGQSTLVVSSPLLEGKTNTCGMTFWEVRRERAGRALGSAIGSDQIRIGWPDLYCWLSVRWNSQRERYDAPSIRVFPVSLNGAVNQ